MRRKSMETFSNSDGFLQQSFEDRDQGASRQYREGVSIHISVVHKTDG